MSFGIVSFGVMSFVVISFVVWRNVVWPTVGVSCLLFCTYPSSIIFSAPGGLLLDICNVGSRPALPFPGRRKTAGGG